MNKNAILIDALDLLLEVEINTFDDRVKELEREESLEFMANETIAYNDRINDMVKILADLKRDYQFDMSIEIMEELEGRYGFFRSQYSLHEYFFLHYKRLSIEDCTRILTILKPA